MIKILILIFPLWLFSTEYVTFFVSNTYSLTAIESNTSTLLKKDSIRFYRKNNREVVGLKNQFFMKLKNEKIDFFLDKYHLQIIKVYENNLYLLKSDIDVLSILNRIERENNVIYIYPDFLRRIDIR